MLSVQEKCAALFAGRPLVAAALNAALGAGAQSVAVVAGPEVRGSLGGLPDHCVFAEPGSNPVDSAKNGAAALGEAARIAFIPGDTPLIRADHLRDFMAQTPDQGTWLATGITSRESIERSFGHVPGVRYVKLSGGQYVGGGLFAASQEGFHSALDLLTSLADNRKSQLGMARKFGFLDAIRYFTGRLSIEGAERAGSRVFGCEGRIIPGCAPETIMDVDNVEDWNYLKNYEPGTTGASSST